MKLTRAMKRQATELLRRGEPWYYIAKEVGCAIVDLSSVAMGRDPVEEDKKWREAGRSRGELWGADGEGLKTLTPDGFPLGVRALPEEKWLFLDSGGGSPTRLELHQVELLAKVLRTWIDDGRVRALGLDPVEKAGF